MPIDLPYPNCSIKKQLKWPIEYELKGLGFYILENDLNKEIEERFYRSLVNLAKAVINHKYGPSSRIDMNTLPHEIASSLMMSIVVKRKNVYSWTNLMKKVVRDQVSTYFRKEFYGNIEFLVPEDKGEKDTVQDETNCGLSSRKSLKIQIRTAHVDVYSHLEEDNSEGAVDVVDGLSFEEYGYDNNIKSEDLIYLSQIAERSANSLFKMHAECSCLKHWLILRLAIYEVTYGSRHKHYSMLCNSDQIRYNYYVSMLRIELSPILNQAYMMGYIL